MTKEQEHLLLAQTLEARKSVLETIEVSVQGAIEDLNNRYKEGLDFAEIHYSKVEAFQEVLNLVNSLKTVYFVKGKTK